MTAFPLIFDGHNDTVLSVLESGRSFFNESTEGHIDLPRARAGGLGGGSFACFVPDPGVPIDIEPDEDGITPPDVYSDVATMPPPMRTDYAQNHALTELGMLLKIARDSNGQVRIVRTAAELEECLAEGVFAMELHIEGAEAIDSGLTALEVLHAAGLRSVGIVWSRSNAFGHGVPFKVGASPDTGPGLTDAGKALVASCNELGIVVDVSHLNEKGFWDVASTSRHPVVATHCGAHVLSPVTRNLTDKQLDAIRDSTGVVGINFHVGFLHPEGSADADATSLTAIADHLDYVADRIGIDHVALGSDFDGATMPSDLGDAAGLPKLMGELQRRGYDEAALIKIAHGNFIRVFRETWGA